MKLHQKIALISIVSTLFIAGCQTPSNTLVFSTPVPTSSFNTQNQTALVNVITQDQRPSREVASYTKDGKINRLNAVPDVEQMYQQAMQQNLNAKGFKVVQGAGNVNMIVNVKKFFAEVEQGNLRHKINANIGIEVIVQGTSGQFSKNFNASRSYEGALGADNSGIQKVLAEAYTDSIYTLYNDNEITNAVHQLK